VSFLTSGSDRNDDANDAGEAVMLKKMKSAR
jgi:hypothetical protein